MLMVRKVPPKTKAGVRSVPISRPTSHWMLKAWKIKSKFKGPDDLVFPNSKGKYLGHDNLIKRRFFPLFDKLEAAHEREPMVFSETATPL